MARPVHGGDIYEAARRLGRTPIDFSASLNPMGMPEGVRRAAAAALARAAPYPDPLCRDLTGAIAVYEGVKPEQVLCGAGAADLIFRLAAALRPARALVLAPTFAEYGQALALTGCAVSRHALSAQNGFAPTESLLEEIVPGVGLVVLCNPNNPTGQAAPRGLMEAALARCEAVGATLLLDECFVDFLDRPDQFSLLPLLNGHPALILLKSFTKLYAMAGLRLGYCLCADRPLLERMAVSGPPWAVSTVAQAAGLAALAETGFRRATRALIAAERPFLSGGLRALGCDVIGSMANYVFFRAPVDDLPDRLLPRGLLLRSCASFEGLNGFYCRAAVRGRADNQVLLDAVSAVLPTRFTKGGDN